MTRVLLILAFILAVPAGVSAAVPSPPQHVCVDNNCSTAPGNPGEGIKWHPGHYMTVQRGEAFEVVLSRRVPEVCAEPALQGLQYREDWPDLEGAEGQYTFDKLTELYDALAACKKRLIVEIWAVTFSMSDPGAAVPAYLLNDAKYDGGVARTSVGYIAKMWEAPVMDRLLALYGALAARFDTAPYFEAIVFSETATSKVGDTYSPSAWVSQLKRAISTIRSNWPHTNVVFYNNFIQGASESQLADVYAALRTSDAATGAPDVLPPPHAVRGEMIYRGELAGGADLRGQIPAMFAVQTPELGGKEGTFTPKQLFDQCVSVNGCTHMFWVRNTSTGGSEQRWETGILPFLRANPRTRESCPRSFSTCSD